MHVTLNFDNSVDKASVVCSVVERGRKLQLPSESDEVPVAEREFQVSPRQGKLQDEKNSREDLHNEDFWFNIVEH